MKKSDLKTGMLVELRNGKVYMVINDLLVSCNTFMGLADYDNDMLSYNGYSYNVAYDIVRVSNVKINGGFVPSNWTSRHIVGDVFWCRTETIEIDGLQYSKDFVKSLINIVEYERGESLEL